jgi:pilus assembly protein Flp/PilA
MTATLATARRLLDDDTGATAIEYAMLAAFIAVAIIAAVASVGQRMNEIFTETNSELVEHMPAVD